MEWTATNTLPPRQRETLIGLATGKTSKELARDAGVSPRAIDNAVFELAHKLRLHTSKRALIVAEACARGWLRTTAAMLLVALSFQAVTNNQEQDMRLTSRTARTTRIVRIRNRELEVPFDIELA